MGMGSFTIHYNGKSLTNPKIVEVSTDEYPDITIHTVVYEADGVRLVVPHRVNKKREAT